MIKLIVVYKKLIFNALILNFLRDFKAIEFQSQIWFQKQ